MTQLSPMHQIAAVKDRNAGEVLEGTGHKVVVVSYPADAWVWIEATRIGFLKRMAG